MGARRLYPNFCCRIVIKRSGRNDCSHSCSVPTRMQHHTELPAFIAVVCLHTPCGCGSKGWRDREEAGSCQDSQSFGGLSQWSFLVTFFANGCLQMKRHSC